MTPRPYKPKASRVIQESTSGRVFWQSGQPHTLDVLFDEAKLLHEQLPDSLQRMLHSAQHIQTQLAPLLTMDTSFEELFASLDAADQSALHAIAERFSDRKHVDHLAAVFAIVRRKRLLGRLHAIQAALDLALGLLEEEDALSHDSIQSVMATCIQQEAAGKHHNSVSLPAQKRNTDALSSDFQEPRQVLSKEERRLQGIKQPIIPLVTSTDRSRALLSTFEAHLPELRAQLLAGNGWFEPFFIRKKHLKDAVKVFARALQREKKRDISVPVAIEQAVHPEVVQLLRQGAKSFPKQLQEEVYDYTEYGPYVKYRWRKDKHIYTISMGLRSDYPESFFLI